MELSADAKRDIEKLVVKATERLMEHAFEHARETIKSVAQHVHQSHQLASALHANAVNAGIDKAMADPSKK